MSLPVDSGRRAHEGDDTQDLTDTDSAPRSDGSSTPRLPSCHGQLKFGSCASTFHPPPIVRSGPSSTAASSSSLSTSAATSPKLYEAGMASSSMAATNDAIAAPSPATTADTVVPSSTFSVASTRSPSVSSVSSIPSRISFANCIHSKIPMPRLPHPVDSPTSSTPHDLSPSSFNPALPEPVLETQRRVVSSGSTSPVEEEEETITLPVRIIKQYRKDFESIRKDRDQLRREVERQTDFHRQLVALCEEEGIRITTRMYAALASGPPAADHDQEHDNACEESSEDSQVLHE